jgi:cysteinyl-tRNA synthetase
MGNYDFDFYSITVTFLLFRLNESKLAFRVALCDSLVSRTNIYINTRRQSLNVALVEQSARWTGDMLRMFGLDEREKLELGWGQETVSDANVTNVSISIHIFTCLS